MTDKEVEDMVEAWNWNLSIFEIYDEVRDNSDSVNEKLLTYAYHFFKEDKMIAELKPVKKKPKAKCASASLGPSKTAFFPYSSASFKAVRLNSFSTA